MSVHPEAEYDNIKKRSQEIIKRKIVLACMWQKL